MYRVANIREVHTEGGGCVQSGSVSFCFGSTSTQNVVVEMTR